MGHLVDDGGGLSGHVDLLATSCGHVTGQGWDVQHRLVGPEAEVGEDLPPSVGREGDGLVGKVVSWVMPPLVVTGLTALIGVLVVVGHRSVPHGQQEERSGALTVVRGLHPSLVGEAVGGPRRRVGVGE